MADQLGENVLTTVYYPFLRQDEVLRNMRHERLDKTRSAQLRSERATKQICSFSSVNTFQKQTYKKYTGIYIYIYTDKHTHTFVQKVAMLTATDLSFPLRLFGFL